MFITALMSLLLPAYIHGEEVYLYGTSSETEVHGSIYLIETNLESDLESESDRMQSLINQLKRLSDTDTVQKTAYTGGQENFGVGLEDVWVCFVIHAGSLESEWYLVSPISRIDFNDVWVEYPNGESRHMAAGLAQPTTGGAITGPNLAFPLKLNNNSVNQVYVRIFGDKPRIVNLGLMEESAYLKLYTRENQKHALYLGASILIMIVVVIMSIRMRKKFPLIYVVFILTMVCFFIVNNHYFKSNFPEFILWVHARLGYVFGSLGVISMGLFMNRLVLWRERFPRMTLVINSLLLAVFLLAVSIAFMKKFPPILMTLLYVVDLAFLMLFVASLILIALKGYRPAVFSLIGSAVLGVFFFLYLFFGISTVRLSFNRDLFFYLGFAAEYTGIIFALVARANLDNRQSVSLLGRFVPIFDPFPEQSDEESIQRLNTKMRMEELYRNSELSLRDLAESIGMTPHALSELLNAGAQKNFNLYVNEFRVRLACHLLINEPHKKILEVAFEVGFNSKSSFNSAFKSIMGVTPRQYRNRQL
ncbi:MAG: helix-turn-helix domain-containing protein [Leptospiraceae bacterium]|nr:helix-turn-helix domain-containing protein [Leptospiraceae bacterium]